MREVKLVTTENNKKQAIKAGMLRVQQEVTINGQLGAWLLWQQQWMLPDVYKIPCNDTRVFNTSGEVAYGLRILIDFLQMIQFSRKQTKVRYDGEVVKKRRIARAVFAGADLGFAVGCGVAYFFLGFSGMTPLYVASTALILAKTTYQLVKNLVQANRFCQTVNKNLEAKKQITLRQVVFGGSYFDHVPAYRPQQKMPLHRDQVVKAQLEYHRRKVHRSMFDVGCAIAMVVLTALWVICPALSLIGTIATALLWYGVRRKMTKELKQQKRESVKLSTAAAGLFVQNGLPEKKAVPKKYGSRVAKVRV